MVLINKEFSIAQKYIVFFALLVTCLSCENQKQDEATSYQTFFEASKGKETATYEETIAFYMRLARDFPQINIHTIGSTDSGYPLHMVTFNPDGDFNLENVRKEKAIILINNGLGFEDLICVEQLFLDFNFFFEVIQGQEIAFVSLSSKKYLLSAIC